MWIGTFKGRRGFKTYKFVTSNCISGTTPAARYSKDGIFSLIYRRNCSVPNKKELSNAIRGILGYKGKYLTIVNYAASSSTIEYYCLLEDIPTESTMEKMENFLSKDKTCFSEL